MRSFCVGLVVLLLTPVADAGEILEAVRTKDVTGAIEIQVDLNAPVNYVKHFPTSRGKILQIQIRLDELSEEQLKRRESLEPPDGETLLRDVIYEGNVRGGPFLVLRFARVVSFAIDTPQGNTLTVVVEKDVVALAAEGDTAAQGPQGQQDAVARMMREARQALTRGENDKAVLLFSRILEMPDHDFVEDAKEYLGVARERNGQLDLAKQEYEDYLKQYPKGRRVATVKQRLMALNARLQQSPRRSLREGRRQQATTSKRTQTFGRLSQTYYNAISASEGGDSERAKNLLMSFFDVTSRSRSMRQEMQVVFSGSNQWDFLNDDPTEPDSEYRIRSAYFDYKGRSNGLSGTIGRQSASTGGVLGRFDGTVFGYRARPKLQINGVVGMPVDYSDPNKIQSNKPMVGARLDFLEWFKHWNWSTYAIRQNNDDILDRLAVGGDARYFRDRTTFFSILDYDVSYKVLNIFTTHTGWEYNPDTKLTAHIDYRRTPITLTANALQGIPNISAGDAGVLGVTQEELAAIQNNLTISEMLKYMSEEEIRQRALANTGRSYLVNLGVIRNLRERLQLNANLSVSRVTSISPEITLQDVAVDDQVLETVSRDTSLSSQLIARDLWLPRDVMVAGVRLSNTSNYNRISFNLIGRVPFRKNWRGDARVRLDYTKRKDETAYADVKFSPAFKLDYQWRRTMLVEAEAGVETTRTQQPNGDYTWSYLNIGWRYTF